MIAFTHRRRAALLCLLLIPATAGWGQDGDQADRLAGELGKAWDILNGGDAARAVVFVDGVMETIGAEAQAEARRMKGFAPSGRERDYHRVNVAGTLLYVRALGLQRSGQRDAWLEGLKRVWKEYPFAQAWDPQGWYWKPAQAAKKEGYVEVLTAAIKARSLEGSPFPAVEDALDFPQMSVALASVTSGLLEGEEYQELEYLATTLRDKKLRYPDGAWMLRTFYTAASGAAGPDKEDASWERTRERLARWREAVPASVTAPVAEANRLIRFAWKARGSGAASEVKEERWPIFKARIEEARAALEKAPRACPEWYCQRLVVARAQSQPLNEQNDLFEEGWKVVPGYTPMIEDMVANLLPRWCGQKGQWQRFAGRLGEKHGAVAYTLAVNEAWQYERAEILDAPGIDRTLYRQGWKEHLDARRGSLSLAHLALVMGLSIKDSTISALGFEVAGDRYHPSFWNLASDYLALRKKAVAPSAKD